MRTIKIWIAGITWIYLSSSFTYAGEPLTISRAWDDLGGWLTVPFYGTTEGYLAGAGALAITGICFANDRHWEESIRDWGNKPGWHDAAQVTTTLGNTYVVIGGLGSLAAISLINGELGLQEEVWAMGESAAYTGILGELLKKSTGRARPNQSTDPYDFHGPSLNYDSFPSGHAILAGSLAGCIIRRHPEVGIIIPTAVVALAVGTSRIMLGKHYPSDVVAGLAIGFCSGWTLGRPYKNMDYGFWYDGKSMGVALSFNIQ